MRLLFLLLFAFLILDILEKAYRRLWHRNLKVDIQFQPHPVMEGETAFLTETIENRKFLPIPMLQVEFLLDKSLEMEDEENASQSDKQYKRDVFSISFYQKISRKIPLYCSHRGYFCIRQANLTARGLRMEGSSYRDVLQDTFLYVYPKDIPSDRIRLPLNQLGGLLEGRKGMVEDPFAFGGIREYDGTDPMNKINWKASARMGNLMVNLQNSTYSPKVACFLDVEDVTMWKHREVHEEGIRLAASVLRELLRKGVPSALFCNGEDVLSSTPIRLMEGNGRGQIEKVNRSLSRLNLEAKKRPEPIREQLLERAKGLTMDSAVVILITESQDEELINLVKKMASTGISFLWLGIFYRDESWQGPNIHGVSYLKWEVEHEG